MAMNRLSKMVATALLLVLAIAPTAIGVTYTVGDINQWDSGVNYTDWVKGKTFRVGDILEFKYGPTHSVDMVDKAGYDGCDGLSATENHSDGDTKIELKTVGAKYYICPTLGHCANGMKLAVTVVSAISGTPAAPTPPSSTPGTPAAIGVTYTVGDVNQWNSGVNYTDWVKGKTFRVGDTLEFKYGPKHSVDVVDKAGYDGCDGSSATENHSNGDTKIELKTVGAKYYICPTLGHCDNGMKLEVTVVSATSGTPAAPTPPSSTPGTPAGIGVTHTVGDVNQWDSGVNYTDWVKGKTFRVGDTLEFKYGPTHSVDVVDKAGYDGCDGSSATENHSNGDTKIELKTVGAKYYICPTLGHCANGMKLAVTVVASTSGAPPAPTPPSSTPGTPAAIGVTYTVGDVNQWASGVNYTDWVKGKTFRVGDILEFKYDATHSVDVVDKAGYDGCDGSSATENYSNGDTKIELKTVGTKYYICPRPGHCDIGMKLAVTVVAATPTSSPPPPKDNGASKGVMNYVLVGVSTVLGYGLWM